MPRGRADLCGHGAAGGCSRGPHGHALLRRATCVPAWRNGADVLADERVPCSALAEMDFEPANWHRRQCAIDQFTLRAHVAGRLVRAPDRSTTVKVSGAIAGFRLLRISSARHAWRRGC